MSNFTHKHTPVACRVSCVNHFVDLRGHNGEYRQISMSECLRSIGKISILPLTISRFIPLPHFKHRAF